MPAVELFRDLASAAAGVVTAFASERAEGEEWETNGRHFKRVNGKTVRVAGQGGEPAEKPGLLRRVYDATLGRVVAPVKRRYGKRYAAATSALIGAPVLGSVLAIPPLLAVAELDRQVRGAPSPESSGVKPARKPRARKAKPRTPERPSPGPPATSRAHPAPTLRQPRTEVGGKPVVATKTGTAPPAPADPPPTPSLPTPEGKPDIDAIKLAVDQAIEHKAGKGKGWSYDFRRARELLEKADARIDHYGQTDPEGIQKLAYEVTYVEPKSAEHATRLLKAWVAETLEILGGLPGAKPRLDPLGNLPRMSEQARLHQFAELRGRAAGFARLVAALAS